MLNLRKEKFSRFSAGAVLVLSLCFMLCLLVSAFVSTTLMSAGGGEGEVVTFLNDSVFLNIVIVLFMAAVLYLLLKLLENVPLKAILTVLIGWTLVFGCAFVCSAKLSPSQDSYICTFFALQASKGDYSYYHDYFRFFPFQLGFVLYEEAFFRIFGIVLPNAPEGFSAVALQLLNVIYTAAAYFALVKISGIISNSVKVQKLTALLLILCPQPVFFCTFMYGNTPSFCLACYGIWMFLLFQKEGRVLHGVLCGIFIAGAVLLKLNALIYVVAIGIVWVICIIKKPSLKSLACLALLAALTFAVKPLPQKYYEANIGESLGSGIPQWSWMAMGLHEGESCAGWYSPEYTTTAFIENGFDSEKTSENAKTAISERIRVFRDDIAMTAEFFYRKLVSQWNEPTYQSIWTNQVRSSYSESGGLFDFFCTEHADALADYMNFFQQLIFLGYTLALILLLKKRNILNALPSLAIFGAMLYHLIFEAKSQQSMGYFMLMIPLAAYGLSGIFTLAKHERN